MLVILACIVGFAMCTYGVAVVCQQLFGGSAAGGVKRVVKFVISAFTALQVLAHVGKRLPPGLLTQMSVVDKALASPQVPGEYRYR